MGVPKMRTLSPRGVKIKRIGQKAISCSRVHSAIEDCMPSVKSAAGKKRILPKIHLRMPRFTFFRLAILGAASIVLVAGAAGYYYYDLEQEKTRAIAEEAVRKRNTEIEKIASECRRQKAIEKADQIGLLTYDELYDYDECDKAAQSMVGQ